MPPTLVAQLRELRPRGIRNLAVTDFAVTDFAVTDFALGSQSALRERACGVQAEWVTATIGSTLDTSPAQTALAHGRTL